MIIACWRYFVYSQGGGDWALGKRDYQALGAGEIPATARQQDGSAAGRARAALSLTALPKQLPCRDEERKQIAEFLEDALGGGELLCDITLDLGSRHRPCIMTLDPEIGNFGFSVTLIFRLLHTEDN